MDQISPLVAKYGGVVVGLCLDEDGIPETAEGRIAGGEKDHQDSGLLRHRTGGYYPRRPLHDSQLG